mmetsp:Transcript_52249/g.150456  ORF Transcript_52249/g.150456 Transcript_52249/m.150456 type:complete len:535 (+) Transcript_52249:179-1783(+)|eukprot:CAMPEP_0176061694 /NCGR_PEP_ID=MMETSP0120_2-20121206/30761_1 /TAXON_ID=160619 /ORGANISM="Kryptoperidinium foliaceum, Strain CCMP 1326" /LENGTH=534 /DNA_ID=CAMNT_0017395255 /DNA_START=89 /DNA_END=1693 /DNA_ORIENTATION=-
MRKDVNEAIEEIGFGRYQVVQAIILSGLWVSDGAEILIASGTLPGLSNGWHIDPFMRSCLVSGIFAGVLFGNLLGGFVADAIGRKSAIVIAYGGLILAGGSSCFASGAISLLWARFVFGIFYGMGIGPSLAMQVETTPAAWRCHVVNFQYFALALGEVSAAVLLLFYTPQLTSVEVELHWRWIVGIAIVPAACLFPFTAWFLQESPHYLVCNGMHDEAGKALYKMAVLADNMDAVQALASAATCASDAPAVIIAPPSRSTSRTPLVSPPPGNGIVKRGPASSSVVEDFSFDENAGLRHRTSFKQRCSAVLHREYRGIVVGGIFLCFVSNFQFFGLTYALPQVFNQYGGVHLLPTVELLVVSLFNIPGVLLAFYVNRSHEIGHRDGLTTLALVSGVLMLALTSIDCGREFLWAGLPCAALAKFAGSALFALTYTYLAEVFPSSIRATALSICMAGGRLGSIAAPVLFEKLAVEGLTVGPHAPYMVVAALECFASVVVVKNALVFELKGEPLEDLPSSSAEMAGPPGMRRMPQHCP